MKQILHILKYKFLAFIRPESRVTFSYILKNIGSGSIYTAFAIGAFYFSKSLIKFLLIDITVGQFLLHEFISMVLFIFFISINVGNIIVSYSTMYKSPEVNYLLTKPIEPSKIFAIKFLDNFFYSSSTLLMILFALLFGYAYYFKISLGFLFILILNFIPFMVTAGSLGVILLLIGIKAAEKFGVKKVIYGLVTIYVSSIILFFNINSPRTLVTTVMKFYPFFDKDKYLSELIPSAIKFLPNNWLSQTAYSLINNNVGNALSYSYLQLALALVMFFIAFSMGKKYYFETWLLNLKLISEFSNKKREKENNFYSKKITFIKSKIDAITTKDILLFLREPSQVIHLAVLIFLIAIFVTSVAGIRYFGLGNFYLQTMIYLSIFIFNLLLITTLSLRFIFPMISLEGQTFWKIKSAPISITQFIVSKLFNTGVIIFVISIVLCFFSNVKFRLPMFIFSFLCTMIASLTIISINFGMGALFVNYKEKNPIRVSSSQGASLTFLITLIYMLFLVILLFRPFSNLFLARMLHRNFNVMILFKYYLPIAVTSLIIIYFFSRMAIKSLKKDF